MKSREERFAINPMTGEEIHKTNEVFVYGISDEEFFIVSESLPNSKVQIVDCTDCFTDVFALPYIALIINPEVLTPKNIEDLNSFYEEIGNYSEKIVFTKSHSILDGLKNVKYIVLESLDKASQK